MLFLKPQIFRFYSVWIVSLVFLYLISPTDVSLLFKAGGVFLFSFLFFSFLTLKRPLYKVAIVRPKNLKVSVLLLLIFVQSICAEYAMTFYTGSGIYATLHNIMSGVNVYGLYQNHFSEAGLREVSPIYRLPAIISLAYVKFVFLFVLSAFFLRRIRRFKFILVLLSTLMYLLVGLARGTFFEVFEIVIAVLLFFSVSGYLDQFSLRKKITLKILSLIFVLMLPAIFIFNAMRRFESAALFFERTCNPNFCFEPLGIMPYYLEYLIYISSMYFSMGLFFISGFFEKVLEGSFVSALVPMYHSVMEGSLNGVRVALCQEFSCKAVWVPDVFIFISFFGLFSTQALFLFFWLSVKAERYFLTRFNHFSLPVLYFLFIFLLSLPVGNFYMASSSSIVSSVVFVFLWFLSKKEKLKLTSDRGDCS
jgi:hypothetical protein